MSCSRRREVSKTDTLRGVSSTVAVSLNVVVSAFSGGVPITSNFSSETGSEWAVAEEIWAGAVEQKPASAATRLRVRGWVGAFMGNRFNAREGRRRKAVGAERAGGRAAERPTTRKCAGRVVDWRGQWPRAGDGVQCAVLSPACQSGRYAR